jgi:hypothetical protein
MTGRLDYTALPYSGTRAVTDVVGEPGSVAGFRFYPMAGATARGAGIAESPTRMTSGQRCKLNRQQGKRRNALGWIQKWVERRHIKALKAKVARLKTDVEKAEEEELVRLMPAVETISARIRSERLAVLEKALEKIEASHI